MSFATLTYPIFLALIFALHWSLRGLRARNLLLVAASYGFYGWWDWRFGFLMLFSSLSDFFIARRIGAEESIRRRRQWAAVSVTANLGVLGFFKYFNFFIDNFRIVSTALGVPADGWTLSVVLPVGISFYTFQTMSYVLDVHRRRIAPAAHAVDYLAYVSFFPQLVAGPIERGAHLLPQFTEARRFQAGAAVDGGRRILWGLFKKLVIADRLGRIVDPAFADSGSVSGAVLALAVVAFAFQIYGDFSGYSDIAAGSARLFGVRLMRNFAQPYFSRDLGEFWRRWHISLSTWFRDYVYLPLGGSRSPTRRRVAANAMITFLLSGFWHGASWNFLLWGAWHGVGVLPSLLRTGRPKRGPTDMPGGEGRWPSLSEALRMIGVFLFVGAGWVMFRSATPAQAVEVLGRIAGAAADPGSFRAALELARDHRGIALLLPLFLLIEWTTRRREHPLQSLRGPRWLRWSLYTLLVWSLPALGIGRTPFLYFRF